MKLMEKTFPGKAPCKFIEVLAGGEQRAEPDNARSA